MILTAVPGPIIGGLALAGFGTSLALQVAILIIETFNSCRKPLKAVSTWLKPFETLPVCKIKVNPQQLSLAVKVVNAVGG